ncbi:lytic murein transglycosylase [Nocardioides sp. YIM 152588]|uniref:lytic murein transglycosylase n=1 Tax=Nocardioides sp. YIM 152588 TaxID=3158259 RepID=UPI0032E3F4D3
MRIDRTWIAPAVACALMVGTGALGVALTVGGGAPTVSIPATDTVAAAAAPSAAPSASAPTRAAAEGAGVGAGAPATTAPSIADLVAPTWVEDTAEATRIPPRALAAYAGATLATRASHPACGIGWNTLAAIGLVESEHGSIGDAELDRRGNARPPITGVALNGDGVAAIADTDDGALDGDPEWDRAVGPMQFIPATWIAFAVDGSGDGVADAQNLDDAALTAAAYLCTAGGDLTQPDSWIRAVTAFNHDVAYVNRVAEAATAYGNAVG